MIKPGTTIAEATRIMGGMLRDVMKLNAESKNFRVMGPDETLSNRLGALPEITDKVFMEEILPTDEHLSANGRVMEALGEHLCQGWLEGYLLTGRHGLFSCYEAFIHIIDSMFNQHAKWLKVTRHIAWRRPIASLNYLLTSHVWRQDHNGFSHQDPGFIDHLVNKKADVAGAPTSSRFCATSSSSTNNTSRATATTCRKLAIGSGLIEKALPAVRACRYRNPIPAARGWNSHTENLDLQAQKM